MMLLLRIESRKINGEIFNVGSAQNNFQIGDLAERIADLVGRKTGRKVEIEWYGDPDKRSYRVSFDKIERELGWRAKYTLENGVEDVLDSLERGQTDRTTETITMDWYKALVQWHAALNGTAAETGTDDPDELARRRRIVEQVEMYGGILDIK